MSEQDCVVEWEKVWEKNLSITAFSLFCLFATMQAEAVPIVASKFDEEKIQELKESGVVVQSGINLRIPREIFRFV